jgi:glucose-1-phosphate cytidylyltransferase
MEDVPVVILCGGQGMRLRELTDLVPKPLVPVGEMPLVQHLMKIYAHYGFRDFILLLGYKGDKVREYFSSDDFKNRYPDYKITFVDTGETTQTGGRIKKAEKFIKADTFFANYCDGLADVHIADLLEHHRKMGKIATLTGVHPMSRFGIIEVSGGLAKSFKEKPRLEGIVNGGYFVFNRKIFDYLDEDSVLEDEPLQKLASEGQLAIFEHGGFWACMDTYKEYSMFNDAWKTGEMTHTGIKFRKPPWRVWE